jgi:hypothetical protein
MKHYMLDLSFDKYIRHSWIAVTSQMTRRSVNVFLVHR